VLSGLTDDEMPVSSDVHTISDWSRPLLPYVNESNKILYEQLGFFENEPLPDNARNSAKILQSLVERKWKMKDTGG